MALSNIRDLLGQLSLRCRLDSAMVEEMENHSGRLYKLEENRKQKDAAILQMQEDIRQLRLAIGKKVTPDA